MDIDLLAPLLWLEAKNVLRTGKESEIFPGLTVIEAKNIRDRGFEKLQEILKGEKDGIL